MGQLHVRTWWAARAPFAKDELSIASNSERRGALMKFLQTAQRLDISLFHYRHHGADYGGARGNAGAQRRDARVHRVLRKLAIVR